ncbi:MAG: universal stress protein [Chitinophagaceae bacterium]|nr:universal stress protein [Chitinophagaceae bacterium]
MKKIFAAVDFSEPSKNAAQYALALAKDMAGATLTLYYTYEITTSGSDGSLLFDDDDSRKTIALVALNNLRAELGDPGLVRVDTLAEPGSFSAGIVKHAEHKDMDLLVMGITGSSRLEQMVIGSNTLTIINKDLCPVLIVPVEAKYKKINKVVLTTDLKDVEATTPVDELSSFLDDIKAQLSVAHVAAEAGELPDSLQKEKELLQKKLSGYNPSFYHIFDPDFITAIDKFVKEFNPDLIITVPRKHSFFSKLFTESYTKRLAYNSRLPILAIHSR